VTLAVSVLIVTALVGWLVNRLRIPELRAFLIGAFVALMLVEIGTTFHHARVEGDSMAPLFRNGDHVLVSTLPYRLGEPRREDVVALYYPLRPDKSFIERVIAEEGDTVRIVDGRVYVNDILKKDEYVSTDFRSHDNFGPQVISEGYYFVLGDHRNGSTDSRHWGVVPKKYIWGRVATAIWRARSHQSNSPR
jgi:signal peptidase I